MSARDLVCFLMLVAAPAGAQVRTGGFVARQDGREVSRERYRFDGTTLDSDLLFPGREVRLTVRTEYTPGLSPIHFHLAQFAGGRTAMQEIDARFADSVRWTSRVAGEVPTTGVRAIGRPYALLQTLTFSHLATILLRYSR